MLQYAIQDCGYTTPCWIWQRSCNNYGYGVVWDVKTQRVRLAHRVSYEKAKGPIPTGLDLDHLCRVHACGNPEHLEAVTRSTNLQRGIRTKLTKVKVHEIRTRAATERPCDLAKEFGVADCTISNIVARRFWKD